MLRVDFTFDKKIIEKNGYTMSNIYETIKMEFDKKNISCVAEGEVLSFGHWPPRQLHKPKAPAQG